MRFPATCPNGHSLSRRVQGTDGCDLCGDAIQRQAPHMCCSECGFDVCEHCEIAAPAVQLHPTSHQDAAPPTLLDHRHCDRKQGTVQQGHAVPRADEDGRLLICPEGHALLDPVSEDAATACEALLDAANRGASLRRQWCVRCDLCLKRFDDQQAVTAAAGPPRSCSECSFAVCHDCMPGYLTTVVQLEQQPLHDHPLAMLRGESLYIDTSVDGLAGFRGGPTAEPSSAADADEPHSNSVAVPGRGTVRKCGKCDRAVTAGRALTTHGMLRRLAPEHLMIQLPESAASIGQSAATSARRSSQLPAIPAAAAATAAGTAPSINASSLAASYAAAVFGCPVCRDFFLCGDCALAEARARWDAYKMPADTTAAPSDDANAAQPVREPGDSRVTIKVPFATNGGRGVELTAYLAPPPPTDTSAAQLGWLVHDALHGGAPSAAVAFNSPHPLRAMGANRTIHATRDESIGPSSYEPFKRILLRQVYARHAFKVELKLKLLAGFDRVRDKVDELQQDVAAAAVEHVCKRYVPEGFWIEQQNLVGDVARKLERELRAIDEVDARADRMSDRQAQELALLLLSDAVEEHKRHLAAIVDGGSAAESTDQLDDLVSLERELVDKLGSTFTGVTHFAASGTRQHDCKPPFESWTGDVTGFSRPAYCPHGWTLLRRNPERSFLGAIGANDFKHHALVYHGTNSGNIAQILRGGFRPSTDTCGAARGQPTVYFTPSVNYAAHPRYAKPVKLGTTRDDKPVYGQAVLLCALHETLIYKTQAETMTIRGRATIDASFPRNDGLELLARAPTLPPSPASASAERPEKRAAAAKKAKQAKVVGQPRALVPPRRAGKDVAAGGKKAVQGRLRPKALPQVGQQDAAPADVEEDVGHAGMDSDNDGAGAPEDALKPKKGEVAEVDDASPRGAGPLPEPDAAKKANRCARHAKAPKLPPIERLYAMGPQMPADAEHVKPGHLGEPTSHGKLRVLGVLVRVSTRLGELPDANWWSLFWDCKAYQSPPFHP